MAEIMDGVPASLLREGMTFAQRAAIRKMATAYHNRNVNRARAAKRRATVANLASLYTTSGNDLTTDALRAWLEANYRSKKNTPNRNSYLPAIRAAIMKSNKEAFADYIADVAARKAAGRAKAIAAIKKRAAERDLVTPWFWNYTRVKATPENKAYRDALRQQMIEFAQRWRRGGKAGPYHGLFKILAGL